jgi:cullin-4
MRKGQGSMSAEGFEKALNNIVDLVKFTKDKDVFKEFYITQLAKRLLLGRSASMEEEISMVKKLQNGQSERPSWEVMSG